MVETWVPPHGTVLAHALSPFTTQPFPEWIENLSCVGQRFPALSLSPACGKDAWLVPADHTMLFRKCWAPGFVETPCGDYGEAVLCLRDFVSLKQIIYPGRRLVSKGFSCKPISLFRLLKAKA